jgi:magnesium transporter
MLRFYTKMNDHIDPLVLPAAAEGGITFPEALIPWIDLIAPVLAETRAVEHHVGIAIPTREEMQEIEMSARLYNDNGAEFMTVTAVCGLEADEPITSPITFILKGSALVTVRYEEPRPFVAYATRAQKPGSVPCATGEQVMFGLIEAMIDRMADALERVGMKLDSFSREVFRSREPKGSSTRSRDFEHIIEQIGREGDLLGMVRESLVSFTRLLAYHSAVEDGDKKANREARMRLKTLQRDVTALSDHSSYLAGKINFLLDSTLGLINLEQNQIIKIFSIAAVCLMPPTLVASMYGMNFKHMPELEWPYGYPAALLLMLISAIVPIYYFRRKGWF